jgi:hypothetical protein
MNEATNTVSRSALKHSPVNLSSLDSSDLSLPTRMPNNKNKNQRRTPISGYSISICTDTPNLAELSLI